MHIMQQAVTFQSQGEIISANLGIPHKGAPCVIMSHGLEGSKDGLKWLLLASRLYKEGFAYLRFNYRGCGEGEQASEGRFEDATLSSRILDYRKAINFIGTTEVDRNRLAVVASSFGGTVVITACDSRIKAMVTFATPCRFRMPADETYKVYKGERFFDLPSGRRLKQEFFEDISKCDVCGVVAETGCPLLVIHGDADDLVPVADAHCIYEKANEPKCLHIIEGGNHSFDDNKIMQQIASLAIRWFKQYL
jgi:alpha/beta superfamily hydrolase